MAITCTCQNGVAKGLLTASTHDSYQVALKTLLFIAVIANEVKQSQWYRLPRRSAPRNDMFATWYQTSIFLIFAPHLDKSEQSLPDND